MARTTVGARPGERIVRYWSLLFGLVALAYLWARMAKLAAAKLPQANGDVAFYKAKLATARFFFDRILPETAGLFAAIKAGKASTMALPDAAF